MKFSQILKREENMMQPWEELEMNTITKPGGTALGKKKVDIAAMRRELADVSPFPLRICSYVSLQVLMMFDITGSMFQYFNLVREKLGSIASFVMKEVSSEFAVFAYRNHGDEGSYSQIYYTSPLTDNIDVIDEAIGAIEKGGGGSDALTCMEDCIREANNLSWREKSAKAVVIVGDMPPHGVIDQISMCPKGIDYQKEIERLKGKGVHFFPVFCGEGNRVREFYQSLVDGEKGKFLEIKDIDILVELLKGICMRQAGKLPLFIEKVRDNKLLPPQQKRKIIALLE